MKFVIYGNPIPLARHRSFIRHGKIMNYDSQADARKSVKMFFISELKRALNSENKEIAKKASNLASGEFFFLTITFYLPIPDSLSESKRNVFLWGLMKHTKKPDLSNLIKFYEDAANEVLFPDDKMIVCIKTEKHYCEKPRTEIEIMAKKQERDSEIEKILSIYSPEKFQELEAILFGWSSISSDKSSEKYLQTTARILSQLADEHADLLKKVKNKCPGYWKNFEKTSKFNVENQDKVVPISKNQQDFFYLT